MSATLVDAPPEIVELIVHHLGIVEIGYLRLTCRLLRAKASLHRFRKFFQHKQTDLSLGSLQTLIDITEHQEFGPLLQSITVVAVFYDLGALEELIDNQGRQLSALGLDDQDQDPILAETAAALMQWEHSNVQKLSTQLDQLKQMKSAQACARDSNSDLNMLAAAFRRMKALRMLTFEAAVCQDTERRLPARCRRNWAPVWQVASRVYLLTMMALAASGLPVEQMSIYGGQWGCSILTPTMFHDSLPSDIADLGIVFANLRKISLSISSLHPSMNQGFFGLEKYTRADSIAAPARLLRLAPQLEELDLHLFRLTQELDSEKMFAAVAKAVARHFSQLRKCLLRGLWVSAKSLKQFIHHSPRLEQLELRQIELTRGTWRTVFEECARPASKVGILTLQRLTECIDGANWPVAFDEPSCPPPWAHGCSEVHCATMDRDQIVHGIGYTLPRVVAVADAAYCQLRRYLRQEYGSAGNIDPLLDDDDYM